MAPGETELSQVALAIRRDVIHMTHDAKSSHVGSSLSIAELLAVLYFRTLSVSPAEPLWPDRDRFIFSKGHACSALYAVLAERGFFPRSLLKDFYQNGSRLPGHASHGFLPGVEVSTGSLGHGLPIAVGMALAAKMDKRPYRVFCLLSDGECDEGSNWEAFLFAAHHHLDNLITIIDYNKVQSLASTEETLGLEPFRGKLEAFGWSVKEVNGHETSEIQSALQAVPFKRGSPGCLLAHTIKGKGVSFMEGSVLWHYRSPQGEEYNAARAELGETDENRLRE